MGASLQVMLMSIVLAGTLATIVVLGTKAAIYIVKDVFKNEKVKG